MELSQTHDRVLGFIRGFIEDNGMAPSMREIAAGCGFKSHASAHRYVNELVESGALRKAPNGQRAIGLPKEAA